MKIVRDRLASLWPIGSKFVLLDAWMLNPVEVKVIQGPPAPPHWLLTEDARGVRYFAHTDRIVGDPPAQVSDSLFDDLLGRSPNKDFSDLL